MTAANHFAFTGYLPTINGLCKAGDVQGGTGATIVHGSGRVLANGDVVVPLTVCGYPAVVRSSDQGKTWKGVATGGRSLGLEDVLAGREGIVLAITDHVWSENLAVDDHDNLYFAYIRDGVHLMVSRDGGRSWRQLGRVTPPGLVHAIVVSVTARGRGEVALTYYATPDKGDAFGARGMNWRAWMTHSPDALAAEPEFHSAPTSPESAPTMGGEHVRLLHDRPDLPRVHGREVRVADGDPRRVHALDRQAPARARAHEDAPPRPVSLAPLPDRAAQHRPHPARAHAPAAAAAAGEAAAPHAPVVSLLRQGPLGPRDRGLLLSFPPRARAAGDHHRPRARQPARARALELTALLRRLPAGGAGSAAACTAPTRARRACSGSGAAGWSCIWRLKQAGRRCSPLPSGSLATRWCSSTTTAVTVDVNAAYLRLLGYRREEVIGEHFYDFVAGGPLATEKEYQAALRAGDFTGEANLVRSDGLQVAVQWGGHPEVVTGHRLLLMVALSTSRWGRHFRRSGSVGAGRSTVRTRAGGGPRWWPRARAAPR